MQEKNPGILNQGHLNQEATYTQNAVCNNNYTIINVKLNRPDVNINVTCIHVHFLPYHLCSFFTFV